jgi:rhodanese-related sulfurtransferase
MNKEISAFEAANLQAHSNQTVLLDVREDSELEICRIEGALHIPMGQIPNRFESLPKDKKIIIFCHHGMRSMQVLQYLENKGFSQLSNLAGGIDAWSLEVNADIPRY